MNKQDIIKMLDLSNEIECVEFFQMIFQLTDDIPIGADYENLLAYFYTFIWRRIHTTIYQRQEEKALCQVLFCHVPFCTFTVYKMMKY